MTPTQKQLAIEAAAKKAMWHLRYGFRRPHWPEACNCAECCRFMEQQVVHEVTQTLDALRESEKAAIARQQREVEDLMAERDRLANALKRFHNPDDCGDHCSNSCPHCQASAALAGALIAAEIDRLQRAAHPCAPGEGEA